MIKSNRINCPKCDRINSVAVYDEGSYTTSHCFGAGCNYNRAVKKDLTVSDLERTPYRKTFDPNTLLLARSHPTATRYMQANHVYSGTTQIWYNPKDRRLVFNYKDMYVGRSIDNQTPKWYNYTGSPHPFIVTKQKLSRTAGVILVEDCISACNVSQVCDSIALLGTNIKDSYYDAILQYDKVYIALDEDATSKALKLREIIKMVKPCKVLPLKKDLKYYNYFELEEWARNL